MSLETYTCWLRDASPEFPIHFLNIYSYAEAVAVYSNDFETAVGSALSSTSGSLAIDTTPSGRNFLGRMDSSSSLGLNNETVTLTLTGLAPHSGATVSLLLLIIQSWDGNDVVDGTDVWQAGHSGSLVNLQDTTFAIASGMQCYPSNCPASNAPRTGADEANNSLGYSFFGDNVYNLSYTFAHSVSTLTVQFTASGLQALDDESWGIDNLTVEITPTQQPVPEPATWLLLATGFVGLLGYGWRRRRTA